MAVVVILSIVLRRFPNNCANPGAGSTCNQRTLDATVERRTQYRPSRSPDQCTLTRADAPLITVVVVVVVIVPSAIVPTLSSASCAIVEVDIVIASILRERR